MAARAMVASMAWVWLPVLLLVLVAVSDPGVVNATSSALTVMPRPAPTANVRLALRSPPPVSPAPAVNVVAARAMVAGKSLSWMAANAAVAALVARSTMPTVNPKVLCSAPSPSIVASVCRPRRTAPPADAPIAPGAYAAPPASIILSDVFFGILR